MAEEGKLQKLKIMAYTDPAMTEDKRAAPPLHEFETMVNPETYAIDYKVEYKDGQGQGTSGSQQKFTLKLPEELSFDFLFDSTGIIDAKHFDATGVFAKVEIFREMLIGIESSTHEPRHIKLNWGQLIFKGRCIGFNVSYKLFNPDGTPIRALVKASFKGSIEEVLRVAQEKLQSPDLTHYRVVKKGDTLPLLCYCIYGDSKYYLQVAAVNRLSNFRNLEAGQELFFPPISKTV